MAGQPVIQFTSGFAGNVLSTNRESRRCSTHRDTPGLNIMESWGTSNYEGNRGRETIYGWTNGQWLLPWEYEKGCCISVWPRNESSHPAAAIDLTERFESTFKDLGDNEEQGQDAAYGKPTAFLSDPLMSLGKSTDSFIMNEYSKFTYTIILWAMC